MTAALEILQGLARARTIGVFIDQTMARIEQALGSSLTSFNRMDLDNRTATVAFRPYRFEHQSVVDGVSRLLDEHPLYRWYTSQPDWPPVRISDVTRGSSSAPAASSSTCSPRSAASTPVVHVTPPPSVGEWIYFAVNRTDRDFTDGELALCAQLQPGLVALYTHLSLTDDPVGRTSVTLTRREQAVLGHLADGHTAEAIAHRMSTSPAAIRKHPSEPLRETRHLRPARRCHPRPRPRPAPPRRPIPTVHLERPRRPPPHPCQPARARREHPTFQRQTEIARPPHRPLGDPPHAPDAHSTRHDSATLGS